MSKRPVSNYREDEPGRHVAVYAGRTLKGYVIVRDGEAHAYDSEGGFAGTFAGATDGLKAARELLLGDQGGQSC